MATVTHRKIVSEVFVKLKKAGFITKKNFECCQNCAYSAFDGTTGKPFVFYHSQDNEAFDSAGNLTKRGGSLCLGYGMDIVSRTDTDDLAVAEKVALAFLIDGRLRVKWNGKVEQRILLFPIS